MRFEMRYEIRDEAKKEHPGVTDSTVRSLYNQHDMKLIVSIQIPVMHPGLNTTTLPITIDSQVSMTKLHNVTPCFLREQVRLIRLCTGRDGIGRMIYKRRLYWTNFEVGWVKFSVEGRLV